MPDRVIVLSPHLDDAALSIGGTIYQWVTAGISVHIVTMFAGDPDDDGPPSWWDAPRGAGSQGEAVRSRREEDRRAAAVLGATTAWLPFSDNGYLARRDPDEIQSLLEPELASAKAVVLPGWPLSHSDHLYAARLALHVVGSSTPLSFYAEQPYAAAPIKLAKAWLRGREIPEVRHAYTAEVTWRRNRLDDSAMNVKADAVASYPGELAAIGNRWGRGWRHAEWLGLGTRVQLPDELVSPLRLGR